MRTKVENIVNNVSGFIDELPSLSFGCAQCCVFVFLRCHFSLSVSGYVQHLKKPGDNNTEVICFHSVEPPYLTSSKTSHSVT